MESTLPPNPNPSQSEPPLSLHPPPPVLLPPSPPPSFPYTARSIPIVLPPRPAIRLTSEFDSESSAFFHRISFRVFDRLAKIRFSFQNDRIGRVSYSQLAFLTKYFSLLYDFESKNALLNGALDLSKSLQIKATHDVKDQQGEVSMLASLADPSYKLQLLSAVPSLGLPKATLQFPLGEVSVEETANEELKKVLSINGILKGQLMNGVCTALYKDNDLNLRYSYKDEEMSFIPSISLPSNALSFAFKRRFSPLDKMSYWYHFDTNAWSSVYKHKVGKDLKFKAGYDSEVRLGWASLWVGDENGKTKTAPMKTKVQFMLQVPQDDVKSSAIMFRVKKRWDI